MTDTTLGPLLTMSEEQWHQLHEDPICSIDPTPELLDAVRKELAAQRAKVAELEAQAEATRDELATCCLCEYEFDDPHTPTDRVRQVVCADCWPHGADARGWQKRAEGLAMQLDHMRDRVAELEAERTKPTETAQVAVRTCSPLAICRCTHRASEHHDEGTTRCRVCDCPGFRLPEVGQGEAQ